jgi:acetylornithine deacetylase
VSQTDVAALAARLVAIDSVNPDLVPGGRGEAEIAAFVAGWARERGLQVEVVEPVPGRPSVIAGAKGSGGGRCLVLCAHLDTVGVAGMAEPFAARIVGDRLYGRGALDMKGSLAACMVAVSTAAEQQLRGDVVLAAVADEEAASLGARAVVEHLRADGAVVAEPCGGEVCIAHKGFVWLSVEVAGRAAHGSRPEVGVDAIARTGPILTGIAALDRRLRAGCGHPLLGTGSVHASLVEGGQEMSSYPGRCWVGLERRTVPGEDAALARAELEEIVAAVRRQIPDLDARVEVTLAREPFQVDPAQPIVRAAVEAFSAVEGRPPRLVGEGGWMDSAVFSGAGIPAVVVGPVGEGAHATVEWVDVASLERLVRVLLATALGFCA